MENSPIEKQKILSISPEELSLSDESKKIALEQYKLYISITDSHSTRVTTVIKFFLSINLAFVSGFILLTREKVALPAWQLILLAGIAILFCYFKKT
ncbi:MAG: hypothetical protein DKINENOH_05630 [bacterium]|nr:hypothetical protein [bacterium]